MKRLGLSICLIALLLPTASFAKVQLPVLKNGAPAYPRQADEFASAIVIDVTSGKELYVFHPDEVRSAASLTKLMGALVYLDTKPKLTKIVTLKKADEVGGGRLRVNDGATMSVQDMLYSSIVGSANNCATALARLSGLGLKTFVARMNAKARALKLSSAAHFADPAGMDPKNVLTVRDEAKIATAAFANPLLRQIASTSVYSFKVRNTGEVHTIKNTNHLLTMDPNMYVLAGKTGYLEEAQYNFDVKLRNTDAGSREDLLVIVLGSPTEPRVFASGKALAEWAWKAYSWPSVRESLAKP